MTESVDLFGEINSVDLFLNDIWIEPENPKEGETVSIHGSVYNAGILPSSEVSDAITVGYVVNGELVEINLLENILPGVENGIVISSGPVFNAMPGNYVITVIINYHDTLSHLRDNPKNNIVQKQFQISSDNPSLIKYDITQKYDNKTNKQQITIQGKLTNIFQEKLPYHEIVLSIGESKEKIKTDADSKFLFVTDIPFENKPIEVIVQAEDDSFPNTSQKIFPLKLDNTQAGLAVNTPSFMSDSNYHLTLVIFQDSYDHLFKKISTDKLDEQSIIDNNLFLTSLPGNHEYIIEVYVEGMIVNAFQSYFASGTIMDKDIVMQESGKLQFRIINELGEPQSNVRVDTWIYSATTNEAGVTDWVDVFPTFTSNDPYVAKTTFPDGHVIWSEPFLIESGERKVIQITPGLDEE